MLTFKTVSLHFVMFGPFPFLIIKYYQIGMVEIYDTAVTAKYLSEIIFIKIDIKLNLK